jgi:hypothetical protein
MQSERPCELLVIDLDVLVDKRHDEHTDELTFKIRPGAAHFTWMMLQRYDVGVVSSMIDTVLRAALAFLLSGFADSIVDRFVFVWGRDRAVFSADRQSTLFDPASVWNNPMINCEQCYSATNTVVLAESVVGIVPRRRSLVLLHAGAQGFPTELYSRIAEKFKEVAMPDGFMIALAQETE